MTSAEFSFQLTDLETHNNDRNEKMHKWMDVEQHNTIRWKMLSVEMVSDQLVAHGELMTTAGYVMAFSLNKVSNG